MPRVKLHIDENSILKHNIKTKKVNDRHQSLFCFYGGKLKRRMTR